jgi:thiol-disulfide isomerase/thioredoxin
MSTSTRWTIAGLVLVAVLIAALALQLQDHHDHPQDARQPATDAAQLSALRARAHLPPCPHGTGQGPVALRKTTVQCMADGTDIDAANTLSGRKVLLNLWAYWCAPCRTELPAMAEYQHREGPKVTVVTVHEDDDAAAALQLLTELNVRLPTLQDGPRRVAAALHVPNVMPTTVLLGADGSVAATLPRAFANADEIAAAADQTLGVAQ